MIRYQNQKQRCLEGFDTPPDMILDPRDRWVRLSDRIPWDELADSYYKTLSPTLGRPSKDERTVIGAVIIKHKLSFSDEETVEVDQDSDDGSPGTTTSNCSEVD